MSQSLEEGRRVAGSGIECQKVPRGMCRVGEGEPEDGGEEAAGQSNAELHGATRLSTFENAQFPIRHRAKSLPVVV